MNLIAPSRHLRLFIDLENVSWAKPDICVEPFEHVSIFIGPKQAKLNFEWMQLTIDHPGKVALIRLSESAPNALDFILVYHLGRTTLQHPADTFRVISNDRGYDPLISHLQSSGIVISRLPVESPAKAAEIAPSAPLALLPPPEDLSAKARLHLIKLGPSRPKKRATLTSSLRAHFRQQNLTDKAIEDLIRRLIKTRFLDIALNNAVSYAA
jgi:hypothetical protein